MSATDEQTPPPPARRAYRRRVALPDRRAQIADGLLIVLATTSFDAASIGQIAAAAGVAPGLVHYHFADKAAILPLAMDRLAAQAAARIEARVAAAGRDPGDRLFACLDAYLSRDAADPAALAAWIRLQAEAMRHPDLHARTEAAAIEAAARLRALLEPLGCPDPAAGAAALLALIQGYFALAAASPNVIPHGSAITHARRFAAALVGRSF